MRWAIGLGVGVAAGLAVSAATAADKESAVLNHTVKTIDGKDVKLGEAYKGKVLLFVNVASQCGNTPQYKDLEALHQKYKDKGLVVLGFPANDFGKQEPGTEAEIKEFCSSKYHVTFDMFSKISVKGGTMDPLYKDLTAKVGAPEWNFAKILVNKKGEPVKRFPAKTKPTAAELTAEIEKLLAE